MFLAALTFGIGDSLGDDDPPACGSTPCGSGWPLHLLDATEALRRNAVCLDGGPPGLYHRNASSGASATSWVIYLKGGGWCGLGEHANGILDSCAHRVGTRLGNSSLFPPTYSLQGPLDDDPHYNPVFASSHHVVLWHNGA